MRVGGVEETITVTGATPLVDVQSVQQQRVLDKEIIDTLPTGRTTINVAVLIPGHAAVDDVQRRRAGRRRVNRAKCSRRCRFTAAAAATCAGWSMASRCSRRAHRSARFAANSGMIQEVTVDTAAGSAEQSAGGVRMNIIPREGGNTFTGSLFVTGTSEDLQSDNIDQELRDRGLVSTSSVKSNWEMNPAFGGPAAARSALVLRLGPHLRR